MFSRQKEKRDGKKLIAKQIKDWRYGEKIFNFNTTGEIAVHIFAMHYLEYWFFW